MSRTNPGDFQAYPRAIHDAVYHSERSGRLNPETASPQRKVSVPGDARFFAIARRDQSKPVGPLRMTRNPWAQGVIRLRFS